MEKVKCMERDGKRKLTVLLCEVTSPEIMVSLFSAAQQGGDGYSASLPAPSPWQL